MANLDFFKKPNLLQSFSFNIPGVYESYKGNLTSILNFSSGLIGSDWLIVRILGYISCIITGPLALFMGIVYSISLLILCIVQYVINTVGLLFWGISGIANAFLALGAMLWGGFCSLLQIVWVRFLALTTIFISIVIPFFVNLNNIACDKIGTLSATIPDDLFRGDWEGISWLIFNKCNLNYFCEKSIEQLIWILEVFVVVLVTKKIIDFVKYILSR